MSQANMSTENYNKLLTPVKDAEKSFDIDISKLLQSYIKSFEEGKLINFNSAALMIQGSSSIYSKKVEYLHNLVTKLYGCLLKNKKEEGAKKDTKEREKQNKGAKFSDPFCSTDIKLGKNLSCLRKKFNAKSAPKKSKKSDKNYTYVPVDLIPIEPIKSGTTEEEKTKAKGTEIEIIDDQGTVIGKKKDVIISKCKVTSSGWLLLPCTSADLILSPFSTEDYTVEEDMDDNMCIDSDFHIPHSSPLDEGYPPSTGNSETPASVPSSQDPTSVPSSQGSDEGFGSQPSAGTPAEGDNPSISNVPSTGTPMDVVQEPEGINQGIENIPLDNSDLFPKPRRSTRHALKLCQLPDDVYTQGEYSPTPSEKEIAAVKRAIQKKNTCSLPSKLRAREENPLRPASEFCARTFFSMDRAYQRNSAITFQVFAFRNNSKLYARFRDIQTRVRSIVQSRRARVNGDERHDADDNDLGNPIDLENGAIERNLNDPATNADIITTPLEAADIVIENNSMLEVPVSNDENPLAEDEPIFDDGISNELKAFNAKELEDSFSNAARLQCDLFREELHKYIQTSDISTRVNAWEAKMKPYLKRLNQREEFDIDQYGSRILNAFGDSNRKQTITFRNFCKGKKKWEIHRYFMALLPLVNIGNVNIEAQPLDDEENDIAVTLLSRKMHHKELEEFGHNEGEHS